MKNSKLFISVISILLFVFVAASSVFAVSGNQGTITINNAQDEKVYEIYKILDLTYSGAAGSENVAYTIASEWRGFFFNADGTKTTNGTTYLLDAQPTDPSATKLNRITFDVKGDGTEYRQYYFNVTADNVAAFAQAALQHTTAGNITPTASKTADGTTVEFTNVALGYYLVYPKGATEITSGNASLASLTSTLPNTTVNVKATYLDVEKEDYEDDAFTTEETGNVQVGQTVYYKVTSTVPDTTGYTQKYTYQIVDTLSAGLVSDFSDLVVKFGTTTINPSTTELVIGTNTYTLEFDMRQYQQYKGQEITITYSATVTEDAVNSKTTSNELVLTYSNDPKDNTSTETITEKEYVYSARVIVNKVLEDNKTPLAGAEFVLYKLDGTTKKYYKATDAAGNVINNTTTTAVSTTAGLENVEWVTNINEATHLITNADGEAIFNGLLDGTYFLKETQVPDGYNRRVNDTEVAVAFRGFTETNDSATFDATVDPGEFEAPVVNITGTELPETGGMGTTIFVTVGTTLALVAGIVLVTNRRMAKERF